MNLLPCLSLWRPMDVALVDDRIRKDVENREWTEERHQGLRTRAERLAGQWLVIHAGKVYRQDYRRFIRQLTGVDVPPEDTRPGHLIGLVKVRRLVWSSRSPWFVDDGQHIGLEIADRIQLPQPLAFSGRQGIFLLPTAESQAIHEQCAEIGRAL